LQRYGKKKAEFKNLNIFIIGNYLLIKKQLEKIKINLNLKKIDKIQKQNFKKKLLIYDVPLKLINSSIFPQKLNQIMSSILLK
jgi:hypothetical protein